MPHKIWTQSELVTAADQNTYLQEQVIATFADSTARDAAIVAPVEGQHAWLHDTNTLTHWDGSSWQSTGGPRALRQIQVGQWTVSQAGTYLPVPGSAAAVVGPASVMVSWSTTWALGSAPECTVYSRVMREGLSLEPSSISTALAAVNNLNQAGSIVDTVPAGTTYTYEMAIYITTITGSPQVHAASHLAVLELHGA